MPRISWDEVKATRPPEVLEAAARKTEAFLAVIQLNDLRKARRLTQEELAERLGIRQANVSKLERRFDMRVSTLRDVIEAMGGELCITAKFPDAEYRIDLLEPPGRAREVA